MKVDFILYDIAKESLNFCSKASKFKNFPRNDYGIVCEHIAFFLRTGIPDRFHRPEACHEARFLADTIF